jgi:hypothetical protein
VGSEGSYDWAVETTILLGALMRPVLDVYQMKPDRLPEGARAVWLRTWPNDPPFTDDWLFVGKERYPSKWTIAEMNKKGFCYREIPSWLATPGG